MGNCEQIGRLEIAHRVLRYAAGCDDWFSLSDVIADLPGLIAPEEAVRYASVASSRCAPDADIATRIKSGTRKRVAGLMGALLKSKKLDRENKRYRISDRGASYLNLIDAQVRLSEARAEYRRLNSRKRRGTDSHHQA